MSAFYRLLTDPAAVLSSIAASTAAADYPDLRGFVERALLTELRVTYRERLEHGIRMAVGALPPGDRGTAVRVQEKIQRRGPQMYALQRVPDIETIRAVLRKMVAEELEKRVLASQSANWTSALGGDYAGNQTSRST